MKKKYYLILDTETATLPFINELCGDDAKKRQTIAIAKPLVYDLGYTIIDRQGNIQKKENFLIQETFFVPSIFNTAYYKEKRNIYLDLLKSGEIQVTNWNNAIETLLEDLRQCDLAAAYNATFDFKKAIPFTENYISNLYSEYYNEWEAYQKTLCADLLEKKSEPHNPDYLSPTFTLRGEAFPIVDIWGVACNTLINTNGYKDYCLKNKKLTSSATYFQTSAETVFQYLLKEYDFVEEHTALSDALIEAQILTKVLKKKGVSPDIQAFPFRNLGTVTEYVQNTRPKYKDTVSELLEMYIQANDGFNKDSTYWKRICHTLDILKSENF